MYTRQFFLATCKGNLGEKDMQVSVEFQMYSMQVFV